MNSKSNILRRQRSSKYKPVPFGVSVRKAGRRTLSTPIMQSSPGRAAEEPVEEMGTILGQKPGSSYEWRLAQALTANGLTFQYQVSAFGGRSFRGGQVIDFLVDTKPLPTPVFADGEHWHEGQIARDDSYKRAFLNAEMAGAWNPWVSFFGPELHSVEAATRSVREKL